MANWLSYLFLILFLNGCVTISCKQSDQGRHNRGRLSLLRDEDDDSAEQDIYEYAIPTNQTGCSLCSCGFSSNNEQNKEEHHVDRFTFPWLAIVVRNGTYTCLGSLINDRYVLTAASCIWNRDSTGSPVKETKIIFAAHEDSMPTKERTYSKTIADIKVHPNFMPDSLDSDIALLKLSKPQKFRIGMSPICLPRPRKKYIGVWATVAGVATMRGLYDKPLMMQSRQPIISQKYCTHPYYGYYLKTKPKVTKKMMCTSPWDPRLCLNGTGGPLMVEVRPAVTQIVGIVSWGNDCNGPSKPSVYTKVNEFLGWILENTMDACYCG